jgi:hypothetical protein
MEPTWTNTLYVIGLLTIGAALNEVAGRAISASSYDYRKAGVFAVVGVALIIAARVRGLK